MSLLHSLGFRTKARKNSPPLFLHNTLSGEKEVFTPLKDTAVRMYNCGPTVYDTQHIGNMRSYVFADILRRTLEWNGYAVTQVVNITDVGHLVSDADEGADKLEKAAAKSGKRAQDIAQEVTERFLSDLRALSVNTDAIVFPKATDHIREQIALIRTLEEKGYTYKTKDGVYFDTARFPRYGKLGGIALAGLKEGARVEENKEKRNPTDFALWKFSPKGAKRQQEWESPWGVGFPGWHIECSAMAMKYLGKTFDIHTGGIDHIPIHHNNEIAQSEAATGKPFVRYWLHNAFITIDGQKISKSIGNTVFVSDIVERGLSPLAYRYFLLTAHYRSPLNFTWDALAGAQTALLRLYRHTIACGEAVGTVNENYRKQFIAFINADLDTPKALALVWDMLSDDTVSPADLCATLLDFDRILGLGLSSANDKTLNALEGGVAADDAPEEVRVLLRLRAEARFAKDFAKADELREAIRKAGYEVTDAENSEQRLTKILR